MAELYQAEIYQFIQHMKDRFNMEIAVSVTNVYDARVEHYSYEDFGEEE